MTPSQDKNEKIFMCVKDISCMKLCEQKHSLFFPFGRDGITDSMDVILGELRELEMDREPWRTAIHGVAKSRTRLSNGTELN